MSKTVSSVVCETNQILGKNQENVFFHSLYRLPNEYSRSFVRTAHSTSPIQICAVFSAQGNDTLSAMALQEAMKNLHAIVNQVEMRSVLDFESFSAQVTTVLNNVICNMSLANNQAPLRVSMTMAIIEGDTLRIISIGNTKALLYRGGRLISLTEEQTQAHSYVQMGVIPKEAEATHPDRNTLTQYLGRFPQEGPILPEKKVHMKLCDGDEIILLGTGITQGLKPQMIGALVAKPTQPETKASELVSLAMQMGTNYGLTTAVMLIESTLILPGDANLMGAAAPVAAVPTPVAPIDGTRVAPTLSQEDVLADNVEENGNDESDVSRVSEEDEGKEKKKRLMKNILIPICIFAACFLIGFGGMYVLFNAGHWKDSKVTTEPTVNTNDVMNQVMYSLGDSTPLYVEESLESNILLYLTRGEAVTMLATNASFSKVITSSGVTGYCITAMISAEDPTISETLPIMEADPTPASITEQSETAPTDTLPSETTLPPVTSEETTVPSTDASVPTDPSNTEPSTSPSETTAPTTEPSEPTTTAPSETTTASTEEI